MNLKKEFKEYKHIYNIYSDTLKEDSKSYDEQRLKILEKDKEDIAAQHESKEKIELLEDILFKVYRISLLQADLVKIGERLLYIQEAAMRTGEDLEYTEDEKKFMNNLSINSSTSYVVSGDKLDSKVAGLEDIIKKKVAENKDSKYIFLDNLRKSENV